MRIYKCIFSGSEVLCDNDRPVPEINGMYVVKGKYIEIGGEDFGITSNVDDEAAEGAASEGTNDKKKKVIDIVHNNRLQETDFDKAGFMAYIKGYMKNLVEKLKEQGKDEEYIKAFGANAQAFVKRVVSNIKDWQFFYPDMDSDNCDYDNAMVICCEWEDGEVPIYYFWKDGLKGEKV